MTTLATANRISVPATAVLAMLTGTPLFAEEKTSNHTLNGGNGVWRIELRDADQIVQIRAGDKKSKSEISRVTWRLSSGDQFHESKLTRADLDSATGANGRTYVSVSNGQILSADIPEIAPDTQLWLHARQQQVFDGPAMAVEFRLEIKARDLDCAKRRKCRRGDTGTVTFGVELPLPSVRSEQCSPQNSYRLTTRETSAVWQRSGKIDPVSGGLAGGTVSVSTSGKPLLLPTDETGTSVTICIAAAGDPPGGACDPADAICREARRRR